MAMAICLPPFVTDAMVSSQVLRLVHLLTPGNQDAIRKLFVEHPQIRGKSSAPVRLFRTLSNHVTQLLTTFHHKINTQEMHPHKSGEGHISPLAKWLYIIINISPSYKKDMQCFCVFEEKVAHIAKINH
ncbi:hypothetical protein VPH35_139073 [Triticum aestivum]